MANMTFKANLIPQSDLEYELGSNNPILKRWKIYGDVQPMFSKTYASTSQYSTGNSDDASSFYFMSVKPDSWNEPWMVRFKVHSFCPSYLDRNSTTWCVLSGRADAMVYANWNENINSAHYYISTHILKSAGFNAGLGHAVGISIRYGNNYTNSAYYRTFEVDCYEAENCTVTMLDSTVLWANWTNGSTTNYGGFNSYDAINRGLRESGDDNETGRLFIHSGYLKNGGTLRLPPYSIFGLDRNNNAQSISLYSADYTSSTVNINTARVYNTAGIDWTKGLYNTNSGSNFAVNADLNISPAIHYYAVDFRYIDNCMPSSTATTLSMAPRKAVYFRGVIKEDGLFYLRPLNVTYNNATYQRVWTQDIPTSVETDGTYQYVYWFIGFPYYNGSYANGSYQINMEHGGEMYWYRNGRFEEYKKDTQLPYIVGTGSTAGTWLGTMEGLTSYYDGLLILYKPSVAGASTTTLNLNGLGAKTVYLNHTTKLTTHYPANQPILLVYSASQNSGCWEAIDNYDTNTIPYGIRVYRETSGYNDDYPLLVSRSLASSITATHDGYLNNVYGIVYNTKIPTLNPSTGLMKVPGGIYSGPITVTHTSGGQQEVRINYSDTISYWWGVGTGDVNHGMYDNKANKWIISAGADNTWTFDGKSSSASYAATAGKLGTADVGSNVKAIYLDDGVAKASDHEFAGGYAKTSPDFNTLYDSGFYSCPGGAGTNYPANGSSYGTIITTAYRKPSGNTKPDYAFQIADWTGSKSTLWFRTSNASTWGPWKNFVSTTANVAVGTTSKPVYITGDGIATPISYTIEKSVPSNALFTDTDTKNTAGSTQSASKLFMIGATSQAANPQTYSNTAVYATAGAFAATSYKVAEKVTMQYNTTTNALDFVFV